MIILTDNAQKALGRFIQGSEKSIAGLRIGVSAAKGLAWAKSLPCCGVSTLEAMATRGPCASTVEFEGVGHAPMLMDPAQITVVRDFLLAAWALRAGYSRARACPLPLQWQDSHQPGLSRLASSISARMLR